MTVRMSSDMFRKHMIEKNRVNGASLLSSGINWAVFEFKLKDLADTAFKKAKDYKEIYGYEVFSDKLALAIVNPNPKESTINVA